jgi:hypothetical protein
MKTTKKSFCKVLFHYLHEEAEENYEKIILEGIPLFT